MPQGSTRVSRPLTNVSIQYRNNETIYNKFMPELPVSKESDQYWIYNKDFRLSDTTRANGAEANMVTHEYSTSSYSTVEHALKDVITDTDRANTDAPLNLDVDATEFLSDQILQRTEFETAKLLFTTTTYSNNATLNTATAWIRNTTTSAPIQNVLSATNVIIKTSGMRPNTVILGKDSTDALKENQNVHERIKYVEKSIVTEDLLASLFEVDNVYTGTMVRDTSQEGLASTISFIWGSDALVAYFAPRAGIRTKSAAMMFRQSSKGQPMRVKKWRNEDVEGDMIEVQTKFIPKAVATNCAYLFKTVTII